jgi:hypothetical protein
MQGHEQQEATKEWVSVYLYIWSLYFIAVGVLYFWGYWAPFNVNILEYLSLTDIIKSTVYPIAFTFFDTAVLIIFIQFLGFSRIFPPVGGRDTPEGKLFMKYVPLIVIGYFITITPVLIFPSSPLKWLNLPIEIALPLSFLAMERGLFATLIPNHKTRSTVILLLSILPTHAYGWGRLEATLILDGMQYQYVTSQIEGITLSDDISPSNRLRLIGHADNFIFLLNPTNNTLIITKFDNAKILQVKNFNDQNFSSIFHMREKKL